MFKKTMIKVKKKKIVIGPNLNECENHRLELLPQGWCVEILVILAQYLQETFLLFIVTIY